MADRTKIQSTKNYAMFKRSSDNRPTDLKKHKKLIESMRRYGFLKSFPVVCVRENGHLVVRDGQHRAMIAESLGLPVHWVEEAVDFDVAVVNSTAKTWAIRDYAAKYAANGIKAYQEGLEFADAHSLPIGTAFALLAGQTRFNNCEDAFKDGTFKVKDRAWAEAVAGVYGPMAAMAPALKSARFIEACMAVCRVKNFDPQRLLDSAGRCREKLVAYATRDAYLDMLEVVYNFHRKNLFPLRIEALKVMRERNPVAPKGGKTKPLPKAA